MAIWICYKCWTKNEFRSTPWIILYFREYYTTFVVVVVTKLSCILLTCNIFNDRQIWDVYEILISSRGSLVVFINFWGQFEDKFKNFWAGSPCCVNQSSCLIGEFERHLIVDVRVTYPTKILQLITKQKLWEDSGKFEYNRFNWRGFPTNFNIKII